jgi:hypothetical protein
MVVHAYNSNTQDAETGGLWGSSLSYIVKAGLKAKTQPNQTKILELPYNSAIPLLGLYPKKLKAGS